MNDAHVPRIARERQSFPNAFLLSGDCAIQGHRMLGYLGKPEGHSQVLNGVLAAGTLSLAFTTLAVNNKVRQYPGIALQWNFPDGVAPSALTVSINGYYTDDTYAKASIALTTPLTIIPRSLTGELIFLPSDSGVDGLVNTPLVIHGDYTDGVTTLDLDSAAGYVKIDGPTGVAIRCEFMGEDSAALAGVRRHLARQMAQAAMAAASTSKQTSGRKPFML